MPTKRTSTSCAAPLSDVKVCSACKQSLPITDFKEHQGSYKRIAIVNGVKVRVVYKYKLRIGYCIACLRIRTREMNRKRRSPGYKKTTYQSPIATIDGIKIYALRTEAQKAASLEAVRRFKAKNPDKYGPNGKWIRQN